LVIERLAGYVEIDISPEIIDTTKVQARQTNIKKNVTALALSIETQGLFSPILVVDHGENTKPQYELIAGQRRVLAHRDHLVKKDAEKFGKIGAFRYSPSMEEWEKKAISINENFNQEPMSQDDSIAAVTACFNQFDSISTTATKCGIPLEKVRDFVKYPRLPACLKTLVDNGTVQLRTALDTANLFGCDTSELPADVDENDVITCAKEQEKMTRKQKERVKQRHKEKPKEPIGTIIGQVQSRKEELHDIKTEVASDAYARMLTFQEKRKLKSIALAASELIDDGLDANEM
jgi:hypothetical protein